MERVVQGLQQVGALEAQNHLLPEAAHVEEAQQT